MPVGVFALRVVVSVSSFFFLNIELIYVCVYAILCFRISTDTLYSILCNEYQRRMKSNYGKCQNNRNRYWDLFRKGINGKERPGILVKLAEMFDIAPCLMAKLILQKYFDDQEEKSGEKKEQVNINNFLKNTYMIPDSDLAYEVFLVIINLILIYTNF